MKNTCVCRLASVLTASVWLLMGITLINAQQKTDKIFCYYESWTQWRPGNGQFKISHVNPNLCTHITFAFVGLNADGSINELGSGPYNEFANLKTINPRVKLLISMGGWNEGTATYSSVVADPEKRQRMVRSVADFVRQNKLDGFDFDWEYPSTSADKVNYITFLRELRATFGSGLLITGAVGATKSRIDTSYDVVNMNKYMDFINLMTYDLHGSWDGKTGQNAPLHLGRADTNAELSQEACVQAWINAGANPAKLFLGVGFYGRSFTLSNAAQNRLAAPTSGPGMAGPYSREAGMLTYLEICQLQKEPGWTKVFDEQQMVPYAYRGNQWVGYDDVRSIRLKASFAKKMRLAGVMVWSVNGDDRANVCGQGTFPLLQAVRTELLGVRN